MSAVMGVFNRASLPSDVVALVVFRRRRHRLTLRDFSEIIANTSVYTAPYLKNQGATICDKAISA